MTDYIIDPAVFYWINVLSIIQTVCAVIGGTCLMGFICFLIWYVCTVGGVDKPEKPDDNSRYSKESYEHDMKRYNEHLQELYRIKKYMMITLIVGGVLVLISIFIPSKQTSVEMLVAKTATFENVDWTVQQVKEIIDYIVSALKGVI